MNSQRRRDDGFQENSVVQFLKSPIRFLRRQMGRLLGDGDSMRAGKTPFEVAVSLLTLPFRFFYACVVFMVQAWPTSRNGFAFVRGLPALLTATIVFAAVWAINFRYDTNIIRTRQRYELALTEDIDHPEYAKMYAEKLVEMTPDDSSNKLLLAESKQRVGDDLGARVLMTQLSREETDTGSKAHIWLANYYTKEENATDLTMDERLRLAIEHYNYALDSESTQWIAYLGLANIYDSQQDSEKAAENLLKALNGDIVSVFQVRKIPRLIKLQQELGNEELAKQTVRRFINKISGIAERNSDLIEIWAILAKCATLLGDYDQAGRIIDIADQSVKDPVLRSRLTFIRSEIAVSKADSFESIEDKESYQKRLFALCEALQTNSLNREAFTRLDDYISPKTMLDEKSIWLRDAIIGCPTPAVIHIILGLQEIKNGDFVKGQKQWRIAQQQLNVTPFIINNILGTGLSKDSSAEHGNMLDVITVALELFPDHAQFYQTRGAYFKKQNQFHEAIQDFEYYLEKTPNSIISLHLLRLCYRAINEEEKAVQIDEAIAKLLNEADPVQRGRIEALLNDKALGNGDPVGGLPEVDAPNPTQARESGETDPPDDSQDSG